MHFFFFFLFTYCNRHSRTTQVSNASQHDFTVGKRCSYQEPNESHVHDFVPAENAPLSLLSYNIRRDVYKLWFRHRRLLYSEKMKIKKTSNGRRKTTFPRFEERFYNKTELCRMRELRCECVCIYNVHVYRETLGSVSPFPRFKPSFYSARTFQS